MIKAVVFDLDDTLVSEKSYVLSGFNTIAKIISRDFKLEEETVFSNLKKIFSDSSENVFNRLLNFYNVQYNPSYIFRLVSAYREHEPRLMVFKDVVPVLKELDKQKILLGIITDGYKETQRKKLGSLSFSYLFNSIILTDELGKEFWKPHELSYRKSSKDLNTRFEDMIYVGDNIRKDFITANKLGIKTIQITRDEGIYKNIKVSKEYEANKKISNLKDLLNYI